MEESVERADEGERCVCAEDAGEGGAWAWVVVEWDASVGERGRVLGSVRVVRVVDSRARVRRARDAA